jgi:peptidyl-Asp metalloendopeptidase
MNSRWFETFKQWTTGVGLVSVMALTASDALVLAGQGQQEGGSTGGAVCGWRCRASDILWRNDNGTTLVWLNPPAMATYSPGAVGNEWQIQGVGDFNANGLDDILWRSVYGDNVISPSANAPGYWLDAFDNNWQVQGLTDVDQNGESDIVWRCKPQQGPDNACGSRGAGSVAIWMFVNGTHDRTILIGGRNLKWEIAGVGDFDGNRWGDILWRCLPKSPTTACDDAGEGSNEIWYYSNGQYLGTIYSPLPALDRSWKVQAVGRFDR